jgi:hypothetical protein
MAPAFKSSTPAAAGLLRFPGLIPRRFASRSAFRSKNMQQHFFSFASGGPRKRKSDTSFHCSSVQERLVNYGSEALDTAFRSRPEQLFQLQRGRRHFMTPFEAQTQKPV